MEGGFDVVEEKRRIGSTLSTPAANRGKRYPTTPHPSRGSLERVDPQASLTSELQVEKTSLFNSVQMKITEEMQGSECVISIFRQLVLAVQEGKALLQEIKADEVGKPFLLKTSKDTSEEVTNLSLDVASLKAGVNAISRKDP
ncbi:hypothetical protein R1flu_019942 [Riccia fluitans]|uniref:Uncharacterized protein n=1 Tax=Riccia fluitans TaxID=41844 RepID=A0ABD1ZNX2_9MARC